MKTKKLILAALMVPFAIYYGDLHHNDSKLAKLVEDKFLVVNYYAKIENPDKALLNAVKAGQENFVDFLVVQERANVTVKENEYKGKGALHFAAQKGSLRMVKTLVDNGCNPDLRDTGFDNIGNTALMLAADYGFTDVARYLIEDAKADVNAKEFGPPATQSSNTALHLASRSRAGEEIVDMLIAAGAELDYPGSGGWSPLTYAAFGGLVNTAYKLLDAGAKIDHEDWNMETPLMWAAKGGHSEFVAMLLQKGADVTITNKASRTAFREAEDAGMQECAALLKEITEVEVEKLQERRRKKREGLL